MKQKSSYTVAASSDLAKKLKKVIDDSATRSIDTGRAHKLQEVQRKINDLRSRGLLKKQEYFSASTSDFESKYYSRKPS
ncbi:MAG: hypothetical protein ACR2PW_06320 [Gammaproteobacteria bacterium]